MPTNLYYSGINSQQASSVKVKKSKRVGRHESLVAALSEYCSALPPWQGVKFVRETESKFCGGVFRFEILFAKKKYLEEWVQWSDLDRRLSSSSSSTSSYNHLYYPVVRFTSEIHSLDNHHERIAEYCLEGIEEAENTHHGPEPFSRVLYVLDRLDKWFNRQDHEPQMAAVDVQLSKDETHLYHTVRHDGTELQPEGSRLINFANFDRDELTGVLEVLKRKAAKQWMTTE